MSIVAIIGIFIALAVGYYLGSRLRSTADMAILKADKDRLTKENEAQVEINQKLQADNTLLVTQVEVLKNQYSNLNEQLQKTTDYLQTRMNDQEAQFQERIKREKEIADKNVQEAEEKLRVEQQHHEELIKENNALWTQKIDTLNQEIQKVTSEQLVEKQKSLQEFNQLQINDLLKPIKEQFQDFKKSVDESKTQNEVQKIELQSTFEKTLSLFQQQQQDAVKQLREQTQQIGSDAANLTKALKGENKTQGDWGEMILETILENSGLRRDEEYFIQENVKGEDGKNLRPDVIVKFPEGRSIIIDSKVSLTAYTNAVSADNEQSCESYLKDHVKSLQKHVDELAEKKYDECTENAIGFVLMFVPNENSYIAAMKKNPNLSRYAYEKRIIIISPSNLMMALQLAYNLWQNDKQNKNVEMIVKKASDLYDKAAIFRESFGEMGTIINNLSQKYQKVNKQLYEGRGNIMKQAGDLKEMGVNPKKKIKGLTTES